MDSILFSFLKCLYVVDILLQIHCLIQLVNVILKPLCGTDPMLVLEFAMLVLGSCPTQTIELFLSGNIPADLVNSYLKEHAPNMQARYLELMLAMNENGISGKLQNEMVSKSISFHKSSDAFI